VTRAAAPPEVSSDSDDAELPKARFDGPMSMPATESHHTGLSGGRRAAIWTLITLASLLGLLAILSIWVNRQLFDDHNWQTTSTRLIQDPAVQSALSVYLVNQLYENVDVPAAIAEKLPPGLKPFAAPAAAALQQPATDAVRLLLTRPRVQQLWVESAGATHHQLVNVLENKTGAGIATGNGAVTIDLSALLTSIGPDLGLPAGVVAKIPPDTGVITVMRSDQLGAVQNAVRGIKVFSTWLVALILLMFAGAIYLAVGERRATLRNVSWAFVIVGLIVLVVRRVGGNYTVNAVTPSQYREAAHHVWVIASTVLGEVGRSVILYGVVGVLGAVLAGPTRIATAVRKAIAPVLNDRPGIAWGGVGFVYLLLVLWGGTHALRTVTGIILLGALLAFGVAVLRRQIRAEFPTEQEVPAVPDTVDPKQVVLP
jgi:hypothetical protein